MPERDEDGYEIPTQEQVDAITKKNQEIKQKEQEEAERWSEDHPKTDPYGYVI